MYIFIYSDIYSVHWSLEPKDTPNLGLAATDCFSSTRPKKNRYVGSCCVIHLQKDQPISF